SAISLTVNTSCSYSSYTNSGAAASGGITAPGCANYVGSDVWFSAIVPATGVLTVDLQTGVMTDSGMAFYSGTCGSLTLLECDDDDSTNGLMSNISMVGLTPGQTIFIRVWEYGNDNNGTFGICATTPSCPPPSDLYANILSTTSATINWANTTPPSSNGYQYYITTTNTPPTTGSTPTGSTPAGVNSVTLTGLASGQVYYFWVRAFCGGTDYSSWFGPTNYTPCNVGNGSGTTTLSCPSVLSGGLGLSGVDPAALTCSVSNCTNLEATYLQLNQATNYTVAPITYAPPYQYTCLQNPVSVNVDDKWSPIIDLPFDFCFYGNNYDKCLIGSNGTITFDTTSNTPGGYSTWSFNTDLPNTSLFKNTIFGVYHDIDPGVGGKVAWELITLNTGCRALVASWDNIPMFSSTCNSSFYTGMIVLYENTNVIDVYIKEKNICATWNNGNAIVGVQNSTGTAAVVAANRNGLSTNWAVTNEAWRFTPSGPSLTSIKWYEGNGTTGTVVGTTDVVNVCPSVTTVYTAEVTYALCGGTELKYTDNVLVTVTGTKIWDGSTSTNWNIDDNWTPSGVPTSANCVVIPDVANDPIISAAPDAVGYNLLVYPNAQLTINSNQNLTITDKVTIQTSGIFTINNSASLIQINNVLNSGNITYKRESPTIRTLDYTYWSSPVADFNVNNIVSPYSFGLIYKWNTTLANGNGGQGFWQSASGDTMIAGKGYIARAPGTAPFNNTTYNVLSGSFTGVPNNGNITIPVERGTDQNLATHYGTNGAQITNFSDNWNLLGNPYPSAIRASQFLFDNNTKIEGNVRLWTHGTLPSTIEASPFYGSYVSNYTPGDYLTYNFTGTSCCPAAGSDLFIGAAQGFFVQMVDGTPVSSADNITVGFTNSLRSATYSNNTFYRMQNHTTSVSSDVNNMERNRIWLDLVNPDNHTDRTLFGYIENATMGKDSFYDCATQNTGGTQIYSRVDETKYLIQGRALPFDVNDEVPIGISIPAEGNYKIAIAGVDGLFTSQNIYLKDDLLDITHDLRLSPYEFTASTGIIDNRFKIVYINNALGNPEHSIDNTIKVMVNNEVAVSSNNLQMESIIVFNVLGQKLNTYNNINDNHIILSGLHKNNTTLLLKIKLVTGETVTRKIIY
ncbi:MAG: fibronectin type III domain-containing protein, partial [Bacteroidota bacterium]